MMKTLCMVGTISTVRSASAVRGLKAALLCGFAALACPAPAQEVSPAEKLLFMSSHLRSVDSPRALHYAYVRRDKTGPGFSDQVVLDVTGKNPDGSAAVSSRFLSGERQVSLPPLKDAQGNPALLGFLERDIGEMKRMTGGATSYFRKRIRIALAEAASVEPVSLSYEGRRVAGKKIAIQPYLHDPMQDKMSKYVAKRYVFLLSDEVPGSVVQIKSTIPEGERKGEALIEETMTLAGARDSS
jgi:hypothetical protein